MADAVTAPSGAPGPADTPPNPYDAIAYPSAVMQRLDPDRLAVIAHLHGLNPPLIRTARVLEVGGGDGLNLTAHAAAFPDAQCLGFDLAAAPVARGRALVDAAGLRNVRIEQHDILEAADALPGDYDYIIVHGVYAWVPEPVRAAIFRLIGRVLSADGVALVSYNALPGHLLSQTLRTMILGEVGGIADPGARTDQAIALLRGFAEPRDGDNSLVKALRERAKALAGRPRALLAHDEFGACFAPQLFSDVCAAAEDVGLTYLNDAVFRTFEQGFGTEEDAVALRRRIQQADYAEGALFRHSLFVRAGQPISRRFDAERVASLELAGNLQVMGPGKFTVSGEPLEISDQRMAVMTAEATRRYPETLPLAGLDGERLSNFAQLFFGRAVSLLTTGQRAGSLSTRPRLHALARAQVLRGDAAVAGLDQSETEVSEDFSRLLLLLDGEHDAESFAAEVGFGVAEAMTFFAMAAHRALLAP